MTAKRDRDFIKSSTNVNLNVQSNHLIDMSNLDAEVNEFSLACDEDTDFGNYFENQGQMAQHMDISSNITLIRNDVIYQKCQTSYTKSNVENEHELYVLTQKNKKLEDQLYAVKGQLQVSKDNSNANYNAKVEEIKQLRSEMLKFKSDSEKHINELQSKLKFSESALEAAQYNYNIISVDKIDAPGTSTADEPPRMKFVTPQPTNSQKRAYYNSNASHTKRTPIAAKRMKALSNTNSVTNVNNQSQTDSDIVQKISTEVIKNEKKGQYHMLGIDNNLNPITATAIHQSTSSENTIDLADFFDNTLVMSDESYGWYIIDIMELKKPDACCIEIDYDKMFGWSVEALRAIIPILKSCFKPLDNLDIHLSNCMHEATRLISLQFQRLSILLKNRRGGIGDFSDDILPRKIIPKCNLLTNPQYSCLFHYIYPLLEIIDKMSVVAPNLPPIMPVFLINNFIPSLFEFINYLCIGYCCEIKSNSEFIGLCRSFANELETVFAMKILQFIIQIVSQSTESDKNSIFEKILKSFRTLLPLFGGKIDLKIVIMELFCEMLNFTKFTEWVSEHPDNCSIFTIMDLLDCPCLTTMKQPDLLRFSNHFFRIILSLCAVGFRLSSICCCFIKIFSLINTVCLNLVKSISKTEWTDSNKVYVQTMLITLSQMKRTYGHETYSALLKIDNSKELINCLDYAIDFQHPILLENNCNSDYEWFTNLIRECIVTKK